MRKKTYYVRSAQVASCPQLSCIQSVNYIKWHTATCTKRTEV